MSDIVDQFMSLTLADYRKVVEERDEAREAARWLLSDPAVSIYGLRADAIEDYPWLEETDE